MKLYTYFRSSASFRVRIALNLKEIAAEHAFIHLPSGKQREADYLAANPQGLLPALEDAGDVISQSMAIMEYLEERHPHPHILPSDPRGRAHVRAMANVVACDIHPLNNLRILKYLKDPLGHDQDTINIWYRHWIALGFEALEKMVERHGNERFCYGDQPSLADICLVPQVWNARRFETDLEPFPRLRGIDAHLMTLEAFKAAAPEQQADFAA